MSDGMAKLVLPGGAVFIGRARDGLPVNGTAKERDGTTYTGSYLRGKRHGMGTLKWENEDVYEGCFVHGGIAGRGTFTVGSDGTEYSGFFGVAPHAQVEDDEKIEEEEGEAEATGDVPAAAAPAAAPSADELVPVPDHLANAAPTEPPLYDHAGLLTGHGEITWPDGRVYRGPFRAGRPVGSECELEMPPTSARRPSRAAGGPRPGRDAYLGELSWDGWPEGRGTCTFAAGGVYEGAWAGGRPQGEGVLRRAGEEYTGAFNSGQPEGRGRLVRVDGSVYTGAFRRGAPDGEGELVEVDGRRHAGTFRRGEKHGRGRVALGADAVFEGWYCRGKRDGRGVTTSPGGERLEARYVDDELRGPSRFFHRAPAPPARKARPPAPRPQLLSFEMRWQRESAPRCVSAARSTSSISSSRSWPGSIVTRNSSPRRGELCRPRRFRCSERQPMMCSSASSTCAA